jgi:hypothetical protein
MDPDRLTGSPKPWSARPDWAAGRIASSSRRFTGMLGMTHSEARWLGTEIERALAEA